MRVTRRFTRTEIPLRSGSTGDFGRSIGIPLILTLSLHVLLLFVIPRLIPSEKPSKPSPKITLAWTPAQSIPPIKKIPVPPAPKKIPSVKKKEKITQKNRDFTHPRNRLKNQNTQLAIKEKSAAELPVDLQPDKTEPARREHSPPQSRPLTPIENAPAEPALSDKTIPPFSPPQNKPNAPMLPTLPTDQQTPFLKKSTVLRSERKELALYRKNAPELPALKSERESPNPLRFIPDVVKPSLRNGTPEPTDHNAISYTLSNYGWSFEYYAEQWANSLKKWWRLPSDYGAGKVPNGGSVWVSVKLSKTGKLLDYKVYKSGVTSEMEIKVIQSLISSFERPPLPEAFPEKSLTVNWRFVYTPINTFRNFK